VIQAPTKGPSNDSANLRTELQALLDLQDTQKETASTIMAQLVELQASLQVMIDLQKLMITGSQRFEQSELDSYCLTLMDKYRKHCLEVVEQNVSVAKSLLQDDKGHVM
jgi:hypothetical protein